MQIKQKAARRGGLTAKIMGFFGVSIEVGVTIMNRLRKFNTDKSRVQRMPVFHIMQTLISSKLKQ